MTEYRWMLPAVLLGTGDEDPAGPVRRSARDWAVDITLFVLACTLTLVLREDVRGDPTPVVVTEQLLGVLSCAAIWLRRRWPVALALVLAVLASFSVLVSGAVVVSLFTVAVHRPLKWAGIVGAVNLVSLVPYAALHPDPQLKFWGTIAISVLAYLALTAMGMVVRARRQLVLGLRDQAAGRARRLERERIAREMHDVLAHRISLLSLHAGALEFRPDAPPDDVARAAGAIRTSAHQALEDLRQVIGVLRHGAEGEAPEPPQPTLADLRKLVEESRAVGVDVRTRMEVPDEDGVPLGLGRTVYRVVQEGLTNARKHAPAAPVRVTVEGAPGDGLTVEVRNPARTAGRHVAIPGSGTGLIGLAERVGLAGGRLENGLRQDGDFLLRAWLPWPA